MTEEQHPLAALSAFDLPPCSPPTAHLDTHFVHSTFSLNFSSNLCFLGCSSSLNLSDALDLSLPDGSIPGDLCFRQWDSDGPLIVDITCRHPTPVGQ